MEGPMPKRPLRPCSHRGCPALTDGQYCPEHQKLAAAHYNRYERDPAMRKRYGGAWPHIRALFLATHPLCAVCQREGRVTAAEEVHHILPLSRGGTHAEDNLMALCKECHSRITAREGGRWGRPGPSPQGVGGAKS